MTRRRSNSYYRQGVPELDLFIERASSRTPDKTYFYIFNGAERLGPFRTLRAAQNEYGHRVRKASDNPPAQVQRPKRETIVRQAQEDYLDRAALFWEERNTGRG